MAYNILLICIVATFVLISDHLKIVNTEPTKVHREVRETDKYTTKYDNIDVDSILSSNRLLKNYLNCLLDKGPCTADGRELKKYIPDALGNECSKCSKRQKEIAGKVFSFLLVYHRDYWDLLLAKYDPYGLFRNKYEVDQAEEDYSDLEDAK